MIIAIIPVRGRLTLIPYTIKQALRLVDKVICVCDKAREHKYCEGAFTASVNTRFPLGKKWNYGFQLAKEFDPDYVLYIGASDWLSDNWLEKLLPYAEDYEVVGVKGFSMLHLNYSVHLTDPVEIEYKRKHATIYDIPVTFKGMRLGKWDGYTNYRRDEPIGIGRILNRDFLKRIDYKPFNDEWHKSMDRQMITRAKNYRMATEDVECLSISSNLWENYHGFEGEIKDNDYLNKWFPKSEALTKWTEAAITYYEIWNAVNV